MAFFNDQLKKGYICPSKSPQMSLVFFIPKKDWKKQMVQDYHYLNEHMVKNNYPLLLIAQLVNKLQGAKLFTKMDLRWGYNNVCIKENDEWKAAVMILFLGSALFLISSFRAISPFPRSLCYAYHHYFLILGPLTFTICTLEPLRRSLHYY